MMTVRTLGRLCVAGGLIGAAGGLVTAFVPPAVAADRFSYPYPPGWFLGAQTVFLVSHVLMAAGVLGVLRAGVAGPDRFAARGGVVSLAGLATLSACEAAAMFLLNASMSSAAVGWLNAGYGLAALLTGAGPVLLGIAVARTHAWRGWRRWIVLACGVELLAAMPAIAGPFLAGRLALTVWAALYTALGIALSRPAVTVSARTVPTLVYQELP
ncbi:hypothetical protein [Dactylosporangium sp. NPDC000521]|uniref:hypothetical protein n=1 Tax=Dactylosporangium sp. NPDC000521 TaxID=3363975 RepID=UPI003692E73A